MIKQETVRTRMVAQQPGIMIRILGSWVMLLQSGGSRADVILKINGWCCVARDGLRRPWVYRLPLLFQMQLSGRFRADVHACSQLCSVTFAIPA